MRVEEVLGFRPIKDGHNSTSSSSQLLTREVMDVEGLELISEEGLQVPVTGLIRNVAHEDIHNYL